MTDSLSPNCKVCVCKWNHLPSARAACCCLEVLANQYSFLTEPGCLSWLYILLEFQRSMLLISLAYLETYKSILLWLCFSSVLFLHRYLTFSFCCKCLSNGLRNKVSVCYFGYITKKKFQAVIYWITSCEGKTEV